MKSLIVLSLFLFNFSCIVQVKASVVQAIAKDTGKVSLGINKNQNKPVVNKNKVTSKVINDDGTYSIVTRDGNAFSAKTEYTQVKDGNTTTIKNPDGTEVTTVDPNAPPAVTKSIDVVTATDQNGAPAIGVVAFYTKTGKIVSHYSSTTITTDGSENPPNNLAEKAMANYLPRANVKYAVVANESAPGMSKFEINLYADKHSLQKGDFIWLSLKSSSVKELTDGKYTFSMQNANNREPFKFYGSVATAGTQDPIKDGSFTLKKTEKEISIEFTLKLLNGKIVTGRYTGKYKAENRSTNID